MKLSGILARANSDRGNETVAGLGSRKEEVVNAGGNTRDLAIAMLETTTMTTDYTYGMYTERDLRMARQQSADYSCFGS
ncbi:hypothetical protein COL922a_014830 [Colletotrichum nupharicola]|nr:hypothetical protein COL922a_014830 [Colletotrichum nupharicola]